MCPDAPVATVVTFMSKLSVAGFTLLFCAAPLAWLRFCFVPRPRRSGETGGFGAWAPREEFTPKGWHFAVGARVLTMLGLLLYVLGMPGSAGR